MSTFPYEGLERLAGRVLGGEVVFFIGAGFSLDSERNSTGNLIARLLARFEAVTERLLEAGDTAVQECARDLRKRLINTFELKEDPEGAGSLLTQDNVKKLGREYYPINDWMCNAFARMVHDLSKVEDAASLCATAFERENQLLARYGEELKDAPLVSSKIETHLSQDFTRELSRGKALFLDTLGFHDPEVMAGQPLTDDFREAVTSYGDRLRPRHLVLARLAREGLCPVLVTTNFDLLLEGGYRMAGFVPRLRKVGDGVAPGSEPQGYALPTTFNYFSCIADATEFFGHGDDRQSALLIKIHGCAGTYRQRRQNAKDWEAYLPSLVFTFREIQDWRNDAWSRDLLRTLLRTRTLVFCGYSGIDPVLHNTFRQVYEEMAQRRKDLGGTACPNAEEAPAYFFGLDGRQEFHGMEILRAATQAVGEENPGLIGHPNYIQFYLRNDKEQRFPNLDEILLWLSHRTFRRRQAQSLLSDLGRITTLLLGRPRREVELEAFRKNFQELVENENRIAQSWTEKQECRPCFQRIVGWTHRFQAGLLREYAAAEAALCNRRPGIEMEEMRVESWYYPTLDHPDWTAWAAVVEVGLRRMIAALWWEATTWAQDSFRIHPGQCAYPTILFSTGPRQPPACLTIHLKSFGREFQPSAVPGAFRPPILWRLSPEGIPWCRFDRGGAPSAETLWKWATVPDLGKIKDSAKEYLGGDHD